MKAFAAPYNGKQTVQLYHPERGQSQKWQVSTYGGNGWIISVCGDSDLKETKERDMKTALSRDR